MPIQPRLVVTGREPDGTSVFVTDKPALMCYVLIGADRGS